MTKMADRNIKRQLVHHQEAFLLMMLTMRVILMAMSKVIMMEVMATHMDGDMMTRPTIMTITKPCIKKAMRLDMMMVFILANRNTK